MSFNFLYYPLVYRAGRESGAIPGMQVLQAPAAAHRHRQHDLLAMVLTVSGDHRYNPEEIQAITQEAASLFFQTQGSVTRAMQAAAEAINKQIFDRNLDRGYEGLRAIATLNLAILHNDWLFIGQMGRTQALFIDADMVETMGETADPGDYLGLSRRIQMRFTQAEIKSGDLLIMCEQPPESWTVQNLAGSAMLPMDNVKRRLMNQVIGSLEALIIKFPEGQGRIEAGDWDEPELQIGQESEALDQQGADKSFAEELRAKVRGELEATKAKPQIQPESEDETSPLYSDERPRSLASEEPIEEIYDESYEESYVESDNEIEEPNPAGGAQIPVMEGETEKPFEEGEQPPQEMPVGLTPSPFLLWMANAWMKLRAWNVKVGRFGDRFTSRFTRQDFGEQAGASSFFMLVLSLAIPVILIFSSITVYSRGGKSEEHLALFEEAQAAAALAAETEDVIEQRTYWAQALDLVTEAQTYTVTKESQAFFEKAQATLDNLDLAERLDFEPALADFFPEGVVISHIESSSTGIYLLDKTTGSILRISRNAKDNYELDSEFQCAPGVYGLITVDDLVDFIVLPSNEDDSRVMALDAQGNLLYCQPEEYPDSRTLSTPSGGWGNIASVAYVDNLLYVLDNKKGEIWIYEGVDRTNPDTEGIIFSESPERYFDEEVPDLGGAIDLTVNKEDMYILHEDGHMTFCQYSTDVESTECQDPFPYGDNRAGREKDPWIFMDSNFELMQQTKLPNAAIYILDSANRSINKFSYQLNLENVIRAQVNQEYPIPDINPTGFGITSDMEVFLAFENKLFIAPLQ